MIAERQIYRVNWSLIPVEKTHLRPFGYVVSIYFIEVKQYTERNHDSRETKIGGQLEFDVCKEHST